MIVTWCIFMCNLDKKKKKLRKSAKSDYLNYRNFWNPAELVFHFTTEKLFSIYPDIYLTTANGSLLLHCRKCNLLTEILTRKLVRRTRILTRFIHQLLCNLRFQWMIRVRIA